jgi:hypothetical protein
MVSIIIILFSPPGNATFEVTLEVPPQENCHLAISVITLFPETSVYEYTLYIESGSQIAWKDII